MVHRVVTTFEAYGPLSEFEAFTSRLETVLSGNRGVLAASVGSVKEAQLVSVTLLVDASGPARAERIAMRVISRGVRRAGGSPGEWVDF